MDVTPARTAEDVHIIMQKTVDIISNTITAFQQNYQLVCPLTSGYDSRVVFSFMKKKIPHLTCYTFYHKNFTEKTDDVVIPKRLCEKYHLPYVLIDDVEVSPKKMKEAESLIGPYQSKGTVVNANTYLSVFAGKALINGDIIDQIGKALLGNTVPECFATANYFQCKIHNVEPAVRKEFRDYLREIKKSGETACKYDLFAIENRCGRWSAQGGTIYALLGITSLNLFNCRELIELWMGLDRHMRVSHEIHRFIFEQNDFQLLQIPFNPSSGNVERVKKSWILFLAATYVKFFLQRFRKNHS